MTGEDLKVYLPKYLSEDSFKELIKGLKDFPSNIDERLYTNFLSSERNIFQGDCLREFSVVNIENLQVKKVAAIVLSNTCDVDQANARLFPSSIVFAPIVKLETYVSMLLGDHVNEGKIEQHIKAIREQSITQILFLPSFGEKLDESIVFLDRVYNLPSSMINLDNLEGQRILTLSDYGSYLFLFKLSLHFTRIQDKVERRSINLN
jgi:hypothetical protein